MVPSPFPCQHKRRFPQTLLFHDVIFIISYVVFSLLFVPLSISSLTLTPQLPPYFLFFLLVCIPYFISFAIFLLLLYHVPSFRAVILFCYQYYQHPLISFISPSSYPSFLHLPSNPSPASFHFPYYSFLFLLPSSAIIPITTNPLSTNRSIIIYPHAFLNHLHLSLSSAASPPTTSSTVISSPYCIPRPITLATP